MKIITDLQALILSASELGKQAHTQGLKQSPSYNDKCMALVQGMSISDGYTFVLRAYMIAWNNADNKEEEHKS